MNAGPITTLPATGVTDVNVWLSRWPFRRLQLDETPRLVAKLHALGVRQAWAGSYDSVFHRDIDGVNSRLANECRQHGGDGMLVPFGAVNPTLPDWEEDVRRCREVYAMPGVRLLPNYHDYKVDDPIFLRLLELCAKHKLIVQIAASMEDDRTQHPLVRVPVVEFAALPQVMAKVPAARVILLNALRTARGGEPLTLLAKCENLWLDIATLEGIGGLGNVIARYPAERFLFGSNAPFFYPESAVLKLKESAVAGDALKMITGDNARKILSVV